MLKELLIAMGVVLMVGIPFVIAFDKAKKELEESDADLERKERGEE